MRDEYGQFLPAAYPGTTRGAGRNAERLHSSGLYGTDYSNLANVRQRTGLWPISSSHSLLHLPGATAGTADSGKQFQHYALPGEWRIYLGGGHTGEATQSMAQQRRTTATGMQRNANC